MNTEQGIEAVWEQLRATRWSPPARATTTEARRATYVFGLEQAEQMFRAAMTVGPATRPLLVFYGLSQAGRAIAAAASSIETGDEWKLQGHGITSVGLDRALPEVEVHTRKPATSGSFVRLSELLDSPLWADSPVRLNELWDVLPRTNGRRCSTGARTDEPHCGLNIGTWALSRIRSRPCRSARSRRGLSKLPAGERLSRAT